eukprot:526173-Rhodomonas_salina.1
MRGSSPPSATILRSVPGWSERLRMAMAAWSWIRGEWDMRRAINGPTPPAATICALFSALTDRSSTRWVSTGHRVAQL